MKSIARSVICLLVIAFLLVPAAALAAEKTAWGVGAGMGLNAGMIGLNAETTMRMPKVLGFSDTYLKVDLAVTDSRWLAPIYNWRRALPLSVDGLFYLNDNTYFGAGLNLPLKVSDSKTGKLGYELYMGVEKNVGFGKMFVETGYSQVNINSASCFGGAKVTVGLRYDMATTQGEPSPAQTIEKTNWSVDANAGINAGAAQIGMTTLYKLPMIMSMDNLYLRGGLALTDSQALMPAQAWRRMGLITVDNLMYYTDNAYVGAGLNFPVKVSDGQTGRLGGQIFTGIEFKNDLGKWYIEAGISGLKDANDPAFKGSLVLLGYRYDLDKTVTTKAAESVPAAAITPAPAAAPVETPAVAKKAVKAKPAKAAKAKPSRKGKKAVKAAPVAAAPEMTGDESMYTVVKGDYLIKIARKELGEAKLYHRVAKENKIKNPSLIFPGQKLLLTK